MQPLNPFTFLVSHIVLTAAICLLLVVASRFIRYTWPRGWFLANATHLAAFVLYAHQYTGNRFFTIVIANTLLVYSSFLTADVSAELLMARKPRVLCPAVLIPTFGLFLVFTYLVPSMAGRTILLSLASAMPFVVVLVRIAGAKRRSLPERFLAAIVAMMAVAFLGRPFFGMPDGVVSFLDVHSASTYTVLAGSLGILGWNAAVLVLLLNIYHYRLLEQATSRAEIGRELQELHAVRPERGESIAELTSRVVRMLCDRFGFDMAAIFLIDKERGVLTLVDHSGVSATLLPMISELDADATLNGASFHSGRAFVQDIVTEYPRNALREALLAANVNSLAAVPVSDLDGPIGSLSIGVRGGPSRLREELPLLEHVGTEVGIAIQGYRLSRYLHDSERNYRAIFDLAADAVFVHDEQGRIIDVNREGCRRLGYSREELIEMDVADIDPNMNRANLPQEMAKTLTEGPVSVETTHRSRQGTTIPTWVHATPIRYGGKPAILAIARDITERKELETELERLAMIDPLTGAANRRAFDRRFAEEIERTARHDYPLVLAIIDIDDFKQVNDQHGHTVGDRVLQEVVQVARAALRRIDVFARYGGEEFVVLLLDTDEADAERILNEMRMAIAEHVFDAQATQLHCTVSIGLAAYDQGEHARRLLERADAQLYRAKAAGKNHVCRICPLADGPAVS